MALSDLYRKVDRCNFCRLSKNILRHIHGSGARRPKFLLLFVNPTYRNISSRAGYRGPRFPFIGVRQLWQILAAGGLINKSVALNLPNAKNWSAEHTLKIQRGLLNNRLYLTNIVKCCLPHGNYPEIGLIKANLRHLRPELRIVRPKLILAFGGLVFKTLTGKNIKLKEYWSGRDKTEKETYREIISGLNFPVIPVYFPVGRGNPRLAIQNA
mgnify:CR=1 FL=1